MTEHGDCVPLSHSHDHDDEDDDDDGDDDDDDDGDVDDDGAGDDEMTEGDIVPLSGSNDSIFISLIISILVTF